MLATFFSIAFAILLFFYPGAQDFVPHGGVMAVTMIVTATLFILLVAIAHMFAWSPLQRVEQNLTPRLVRLFRDDIHIKHPTYWILLFSLVTYMLAIGVVFSGIIKPIYFLAGWLVILGISIDSFHHLLRRINSYFDPMTAVEHLSDQAQQHVRNDDNAALCDSFESLAEIAVKAVERTLPSLCNEAVNQTQIAARYYLESSKSVSHTHHDQKPVGDEVSFTLFFLFQRLELVHDKALEEGMEPICSNIITALGKIAIDAAKLDLSLVSYPIHFLGKFAHHAQVMGLPDVAEKATCTLTEVSRVIIEEVDLKYYDLKEPFFSIIYQLEEIAKETFRQDKQMQIDLLEQPFHDLKALFDHERVATHQDRDAVVADIDRVLGEFTELALVMKTLPPIPEVKEEEEPVPQQ
ncbi:MAG: hypothetical protein H7A37_10435 [Chlamydiales bacterium]|nr:hypothetical protein [Chlamydiia bacterium]MCP5508694.1 hypothetical protein [Chlamydiales bacterium]